MSYDLDKDLMCKLVDKYSKKDKIQRADLVEIIVEYESGRATAPNIEYEATPKLKKFIKQLEENIYESDKLHIYIERFKREVF